MAAVIDWTIEEDLLPVSFVTVSNTLICGSVSSFVETGVIIIPAIGSLED